MSRLYETRVAHPGTSHAPLLTLEKVSKSYGRQRILDDVSLDVARGQVVALIGENGTGKSTLLKICAGLIPPDSGQIVRRGRIGYCPQTPGLIDLLTTREHLKLFSQAPSMNGVDTIGSGVEILDRLGYPADATTKVVKALSGGTAQKLNLALAMLGAADILLLDEPYQGFDQGSYLNFWDFTERWRQEGRAVVVVTHLLAELDRVDEVVELRSDRESFESVGGPR